MKTPSALGFRLFVAAATVAAAALTACKTTDTTPAPKPMDSKSMDSKPSAVANAKPTVPTTSTAPLVNPKPATPAIAAASDVHLTHRYSFTTDAKDSVGHVDGVLKNGAKITGGQLVLDNGTKTGADADIAYLEFSGSLLPKGDSTTIAFWFTGTNTQNFARVLDFGDREGIQGRAFIYFTPSYNGTLARAAITANTTGDKTFVDFPKIDDGKPHSVLLVINGGDKKLHVFVDGKETGTAADLGANTLDKVRPVTNWVGRSLFDQDFGLTGSIEELRVYDKALTAEEAAALSAAGPEKVVPTKK